MAEDEIPPRPSVAEVAVARDDDEFIGLWAGGIREARDPVLKGRGGDLKFYDHVRTDPQVWAAMQQRISALVARPWDVEPGADDDASIEAAERLKAELEALDFDRVTRRMAWGVFYGYGVAEMMWAPEGDRWTIGSIRVRRARRFGFDVDGNLMMRAVLGKSEMRVPDAKFWVMSTGSDTDDEPYGLGLAHLCYWPAYFKRAGLKSWLIALDKFASPTAKGSFPPGTSEEDQAKLLTSLQRIKQGAAIIHPDGTVVDYMQVAKSASLDYETFDKRMDAWIAKIVLSQTMTTDDGSSRSQSETHMDVRDEVVASDADLICGSLNEGPVQWWTWWNFGDRATPPIVKRVMEDEEDLDSLASRDEKLDKIGWRRTEESFIATYGDGYERGPTPTQPPAAAPNDGEDAPPELAEDEPDAIGRFVDELVGSGAAPEAAADILAPIVEAAEGAESFDDLKTALDAIEFGDEQLEPLRAHLAQAAFAARLGGEVGAALRDDQEVETL